MARKRDIALYGTTLVAAFGVGILVGKSACAPPPEKVVEEKVVERTEPCNCQDVCVCEEDVDTGVPEAATGPPPAPPEKETEAMPEAPPPPDPMTRKRLLAWVRDRSADLQVCRQGSSSEVRIAVTLELDKSGGIGRVELNAPDEEVDRASLSCLRRRMSDWKLPADLVGGRKKVVFGLDL